MSLQTLVKIKGIHILPNLPMGLAFTQGTIFCVKPRTGNNGNDGLSPETAFKTLAYALSKCTADQNDIVLLFSESNSAGSTFDLQSATLDWNKDGVHLIGVDSGCLYGKRAGIRFASSYATASNLFTLSADNCCIANLYFYVGTTSALPTGCMSVTGTHNYVENCHIAGMGAAANVIASAYSLSLTGAENYFKHCLIGYHQQRGAQACAEIYINAGASRNTFEDCQIYNSTTADQACMVRTADSFGGFIKFKNCDFINEGVNGGAANLTYAFIRAGTNPGGTILLSHCTSAGITDWGDNIGYIWGQTEGNNALAGIGILVTKT